MTFVLGQSKNSIALVLFSAGSFWDEMTVRAGRARA